MGRKVKCKICKSEGNTDIFYKVTDEKGRNSYYCNKEEYENLINERQQRYDLLEYVALEVLGYEEGQIVPPSMVKRIGELNKFYDYEVIMETFKQSKETIQYWIKTKDFSSEYGMCSYVMKIIEGNINDTYKQWKYKKQQEMKQKNKKEELTIDLNFIDQLYEHKSNNENNDGILSFLDEGDI